MSKSNVQFSLKRSLLILLPVVLLLLIGGGLYIKQGIEKPLRIGEPTLFKVAKGASVNAVCHQFKKNDWLEECVTLKISSKLNLVSTQIQSGTYEVQPQQPLNSVIALFVSGKTHQFPFTIIDGENIYQVLDKISESSYLIDNVNELNFLELSKALDLKADTPEGYLAPDTYFVEAETLATDVLKRAVAKQKTRLEKVWSERQRSRLKTPYELLKLASIVEKESALASERNRIASVFFNRLDKKMRLQTDPTIIYGIWKEYKGDIKRVHIKQKTPYNTYRINGLPPTPIANPSLDSLLAVAHPESSDYFYFVASGEGGHVFSKTLAEHNKALRAYLAKQKAKQKAEQKINDASQN
ncbi:endolytic transglycosylase MltG [Psychrosphaera sp.]|nr:endolytic transglycosylase MltG [Psychrosphaera sp.]